MVLKIGFILHFLFILAYELAVKAGYSDEIIFQSESIKNVYLTVGLLFPDSTAGD